MTVAEQNRESSSELLGINNFVFVSESPLIIDNLEDPASILLDETAEFTRQRAKNDGPSVGLGSGIGHTSATTPG